MSSLRGTTPRIKIVAPDDGGRRAATYSVCGALLMAALAFYAWNYWRDGGTPSFVARPLEEVTLTWQCPNGHRFRAEAAAGPLPCPTCRAQAFVLQVYKCAEHGPVAVLGVFGRDSAGRLEIQRIKIADQPWQPAGRRYPCPVCQEPMIWLRDPAPADE
ncbi:MAG: hypothetical protein C4547_14655 [Phycisphaerales bacterium]|nr:MAG: hypothetical protein C4547_14655 [Phycisphaerales bacterium]